MVYNPPEEWEGLSCKCSFKLLHFLCKPMGLAGQEKRPYTIIADLWALRKRFFFSPGNSLISLWTSNRNLEIKHAMQWIRKFLQTFIKVGRHKGSSYRDMLQRHVAATKTVGSAHWGDMKQGQNHNMCTHVKMLRVHVSLRDMLQRHVPSCEVHGTRRSCPWKMYPQHSHVCVNVVILFLLIVPVTRP